MTALMGGIEKSFGVLLISIQARYECTTVQAAWIGSIMTTLRHLMCNIHIISYPIIDFLCTAAVVPFLKVRFSIYCFITRKKSNAGSW